MIYQSRADLLIAAGESIKMQEKSGIKPMCKLVKRITTIANIGFVIPSCDIEFPLACIESIPVFVGDELYHGCTLLEIKGCGDTNNVLHSLSAESVSKYERDIYEITQLSWLPPKPRTVLVELLREDAEFLVSPKCFWLTTSGENFATACRKALEAK